MGSTEDASENFFLTRFIVRNETIWKSAREKSHWKIKNCKELFFDSTCIVECLFKDRKWVWRKQAVKILQNL